MSVLNRMIETFGKTCNLFKNRLINFKKNYMIEYMEFMWIKRRIYLCLKLRQMTLTLPQRLLLLV